MNKTARWDQSLNRFMLNIAYKDEAMFDVKRIEGRRWHPLTKVWSTPASLRAWKKLSALGFTMLEFGGGRAYVEWLEKGCPTPVENHFDGDFRYQTEGGEWLRMKKYALLADEPGLGKTRQAAAWAARAETVVVACPKVVIDQWEAEFQRRQYTGMLTVLNWEQLPKFKTPDEPFTLILDEAHKLTNVKARRTKLALALAARSARTLLITGTPPAQPVKLWPFFLLTREREAKEFFPFALRYCGAERNDFGWDFSGATRLDDLRDEMKHWMLRRTWNEVEHQLPDRLYTTVITTSKSSSVVKELHALDDEVMQLAARGHSLASGVGLGALQRLRVQCSNAKVPTTVDWVLSKNPRENKIIIFGEFLDSLHRIGDAIAQADDGCNVVYIEGATTSQRSRFLGEFAHDGDTGVALCQYEAAGTGTDGLQVSHTVVLHDLPWKPDDLEQAVRRSERIGQEHPVQVVTVLSGALCEAQMLRGLRAGQSLIDSLYT